MPRSVTPLPARGLYAITAEDTPSGALAQAVRGALGGGAVAVQYRRKATRPSIRSAEAAQLALICKAARACFIVNDEPELALESLADGVHLGRDDPDIATVRALLGPAAIIGCSCYDSLERAREAAAAGADYLAFGSCFPSRSKPAAIRAPLSLLGQARAELRLPIVAIGGIRSDNGARLLEAGADLLAVIDGVFGAPDPEAAARSFSRLFGSAPEPEPEESSR